MRYQRRPTGAKKAKFEAKLETVKFEEPGDGEEGSGHKFMLETLNPIEEKVLQIMEREFVIRDGQTATLHANAIGGLAKDVKDTLELESEDEWAQKIVSEVPL